MLTLALLANTVAGSSHQLAVADVRGDAYVSFMRDFEDAVTQFGSSSGTFVDCAVHYGPASFDVFSTYEHLALSKLTANGAPDLTVMYPNPTMLCDHPFAILARASTEQVTAAKVFRDYLLAPDQQRLALSVGLRPSSSSIRLADANVPGNLFARHLPGLQVALQSTIAAAPSGDVVDALIDEWTQFYQDRPTTPGC